MLTLRDGFLKNNQKITAFLAMRTPWFSAFLPSTNGRIGPVEPATQVHEGQAAVFFDGGHTLLKSTHSRPLG